MHLGIIPIFAAVSLVGSARATRARGSECRGRRKIRLAALSRRHLHNAPYVRVQPAVEEESLFEATVRATAGSWR